MAVPLDYERCALLVIDLQRAFLGENSGNGWDSAAGSTG